MKSATAAAAVAATATVLTQLQCFAPACSESDTTFEGAAVVMTFGVAAFVKVTPGVAAEVEVARDLKAASSADSARAGVSFSRIVAASAQSPAVSARSSASREAQAAQDSS